MHYAAWNKSTVLDLVILFLKSLVAIIVICHALYINQDLKPPNPLLYGLLDDPNYAYSLDDTQRILLRISLAAGGYVLVASVIGLVGRLFSAAPLYGIYYCSNVFGFGLCMAAAIVPSLWGTTQSGFCLAAEGACLEVDDVANCPYPIDNLTSAVNNNNNKLLHAGSGSGSGGAGDTTLRMLADGPTTTSPCCYLPPLTSFCEIFLGAVFTQTVLAVVLLALVMTQSMVSCFYLCCDCDREWTSKGRKPDIPPDVLPTLPSFRYAKAGGAGGRPKNAGAGEGEGEGAAAATIESEDGNGNGNGGGDQTAAGIIEEGAAEGEVASTTTK